MRRRAQKRSRKPRPILTTRQLRTVQRCLREPPRESGIAGSRWSVLRIQRLLRKRFSLQLAPRYALRRLREAGLKIRLKRAREPGLSPAALKRLARTLRHPPRAAGLSGERWSRARIAELIERRHKRRFTPAHAARLARCVRRSGLGNARDRRLTRDQARQLRQFLLPTRRQSSTTPAQTRAQVAALIEQRFGVRYHAQSIPGLLKRWHIPFALTATPVGEPRPSEAQLAELTRALASAPTQVGISAPRWEQRHIARFIAERFQLRYSTRTLYRRLSRWGVPVPSRAGAGSVCALSAEQRGLLAAALASPPAQSGLAAARWSRALVSGFIREHFQVDYEPASIPQLLRREGLKLRPVQSNQPTIAPCDVAQRDPGATSMVTPIRPDPAASPSRDYSNGRTGLVRGGLEPPSESMQQQTSIE